MTRHVDFVSEHWFLPEHLEDNFTIVQQWTKSSADLYTPASAISIYNVKHEKLLIGHKAGVLLFVEQVRGIRCISVPKHLVCVRTVYMSQLRPLSHHNIPQGIASNIILSNGRDQRPVHDTRFDMNRKRNLSNLNQNPNHSNRFLNKIWI